MQRFAFIFCQRVNRKDMTKGIVAALLLFTALTAFRCEKEKVMPTTCFKARLEVKGICMNYTIKVLDGNIDPDLIQATWTDPATGKTHQNVFGLGSPCDFPSNIVEGEEFYFTINNSPTQGCAVCEAYYPTPPKKLRILATKAPCM
jgi:hypothetical protein